MKMTDHRQIQLRYTVCEKIRNQNVLAHIVRVASAAVKDNVRTSVSQMRAVSLTHIQKNEISRPGRPVHTEPRCTAHRCKDGKKTDGPKKPHSPFHGITPSVFFLRRPLSISESRRSCGVPSSVPALLSGFLKSGQKSASRFTAEKK